MRTVEQKIESNRKKATQALAEKDFEAYDEYDKRITELSNSKEASKCLK